MRNWVTLLMSVLAIGIALATTREVEVGPGFQNSFRDAYSRTNETVIDVGASVRWVWRSGFHTTTSYDNLWDAEISSVQRTFTYTFNQPGVYEYYCIPHEFIGMVGTVRVRIRGDVNFDCVIDDSDLLSVLFAFGATGVRREDVNYDRLVDDADLLIVLFNFGNRC
ncbi:MAG: plastocyanin/azurin family copper-binding protein [Fimbriimonadales bacterium]|nr:plastocyanin/azurin family copper-binding protein [Fimbriimonadales bacterium]